MDGDIEALAASGDRPLLGGFATLSLLFLLTLRLSACYRVIVPSPAIWADGGPGAGDRAIALGGWVSSNYAAVACVDLPTALASGAGRRILANGFHLTQHTAPITWAANSTARRARPFTSPIASRGMVSLVLLGLAWQLRVVGMTRLAGLLLIALAAQIGLGLSMCVRPAGAVAVGIQPEAQRCC